MIQTINDIMINDDNIWPYLGDLCARKLSVPHFQGGFGCRLRLRDNSIYLELYGCLDTVDMENPPTVLPANCHWDDTEIVFSFWLPFNDWSGRRDSELTEYHFGSSIVFGHYNNESAVVVSGDHLGKNTPFAKAVIEGVDTLVMMNLRGDDELKDLLRKIRFTRLAKDPKASTSGIDGILEELKRC